MSTPIARALALVCLALAAMSQRGSACTLRRCNCPSPDATIASTPVVAQPLDLAFEFSRTVIDRLPCARLPVEIGFEFGSDHWTGRRHPSSRESEAKLFEQLAAREAEIAAALRAPDPPPAVTTRTNAFGHAPLQTAFDRVVPDTADAGLALGDANRMRHVRLSIRPVVRKLRDEQILAKIAETERLVAAELSADVAPSAPAQPARALTLGDVLVPASADPNLDRLKSILQRGTAAESEGKVEPWTRPLAELDAEAYASWADRPGLAHAADESSKPDPLRQPTAEPHPLDVAFGYSRHSLAFAAATSEFRCRCAEAAQLPGHPALHADQVLAELAATEDEIDAALEFLLPPPMPMPAAPAHELELRRQFEERPWPAGWSGMTIAEQSGAAARFRTVTGVAMRFRDEAFSTGVGFSR